MYGARLPGHLAFTSGVAGAGSQSGTRARSTALLARVLFVLGFAAFFTLLGGAFGGLGRTLAEQRQLLGALGGVLVLAMGLFLLGCYGRRS